MDMNDILLLAKAGFNAQQIGALMQLQAPQQPVQQPQQPPIQQPVQQPIQQPQQPPIQQPIHQPQQPPIQQPMQQPIQQPQTDPILAEIQKLTGALQTNAILNSNIPQAAQNTETILASIINPPLPQGKK